MTTHLHIRPIGDGVDHDTSTTEPDCVCGPDVREQNEPPAHR